VNDKRAEYRVLRSDGTIRRLDAGITQHVELDGKPARMVVVRDVTEQHHLREQVAIADRMASLGALAAGVAHEINNPLAYTRLSLEIAAREAAAIGAEGGTELRTALASAREGTERVLGIVGHLRVFSRVHDEPFEDVDVAGLLDSTLAIAERVVSAKAHLVRNYRPVPLARAQRGKLGQVFLNLLTNAADAIPEGAPGRHVVRVATRTDAQGRPLVEVFDSGTGIKPELAKRIFDPFFTTKPIGTGTGLGLAMCRRIMMELGGAIDFESVPGATTFRLTLPAAASAERSAPSAATDRAAAPTRGRVLVVDDEPALLSSIRKSLTRRHDVVTASGMREALEILQGDEAFDAILADLMMNEATGIDLYEAVRERHPSLARRFLFMTGGAFTPKMQTFLAEMPHRTLEKPFKLDDLMAAVDRVVARPQ
jgi:signal transduction histidine kinase/CheY-like chemotaxis protein